MSRFAGIAQICESQAFILLQAIPVHGCYRFDRINLTSARPGGKKTHSASCFPVTSRPGQLGSEEPNAGTVLSVATTVTDTSFPIRDQSTAGILLSAARSALCPDLERFKLAFLILCGFHASFGSATE